jgi:hypothetical protein
LHFDRIEVSRNENGGAAMAVQTDRGSSKMTQDHDEIRRWAEEREGKPATVKTTSSGDDIGVLRFDFPGYSGEDSLEMISWEQFFEKFDEKDLVFLYQDETKQGDESRFFKFISKETAAEQAEK